MLPAQGIRIEIPRNMKQHAEQVGRAHGNTGAHRARKGNPAVAGRGFRSKARARWTKDFFQETGRKLQPRSSRKLVLVTPAGNNQRGGGGGGGGGWAPAAPGAATARAEQQPPRPAQSPLQQPTRAQAETARGQAIDPPTRFPAGVRGASTFLLPTRLVLGNSSGGRGGPV